LEEILNFADIVNNAPVENLNITIGANEACNVFRKDEIEVFEDNEALLQNAVSKDQNMFKIPKVIN
jgi:aspartyl/glutamyl-tRNA(Asn/Gln) amidotransferase C subunit